MPGIIPDVLTHRDIGEDIRAIREKDVESAASIVAILNQIKADPSLIERLNEQDFGIDGLDSFNVKYLVGAWNFGRRNLWRLRFFDVPDGAKAYRAVYGFFPDQSRYVFLGVVPRSVNYEPTHPIMKRILDVYDRLNGR